MGAALTEIEIDELAYRLKAHGSAYKRNETVSFKNWGENALGCVQDGLLYLCAEDETYERSILRVFRPGECFSARMLIPVHHGVSYLVAKYPAHLLFFDREELNAFCARHAQWMRRIDDVLLAQPQERMLKHTHILHQRSVRRKLMGYFRLECEIQGARALTLPLPFSDLADYLALDRSAMMREIARMREEGILSGTRRNVVFSDAGDRTE